MSRSLSAQSLVDPEIIRCPYPFYAQLHAEEPVHRDAATGFYVVSRYTDMQAVIKNVANFSNDMNFANRRPNPAPPAVAEIFASGYARPQTYSVSIRRVTLASAASSTVRLPQVGSESCCRI